MQTFDNVKDVYKYDNYKRSSLLYLKVGENRVGINEIQEGI